MIQVGLFVCFFCSVEDFMGPSRSQQLQARGREGSMFFCPKQEVEEGSLVHLKEPMILGPRMGSAV